MARTEPPTGPSPPRSEEIPEQYAVHVTGDWLQVWQYRTRALDSAGDWRHVETLSHDESPRLSLRHATLTAPTDDGYWVYARSYECTTCEPQGDDEEVSVL